MAPDSSPAARKEYGPVLISALWGVGEATLFFIVPDVYLTLLAVRDRRAALRGCAAATAGALAGGALMFFWGSTDPAGAASALLSVPAIRREMLEKVYESLASTGALALFLGPVTGTPYKIYAVESGALGLSPLAFCWSAFRPAASVSSFSRSPWTGFRGDCSPPGRSGRSAWPLPLSGRRSTSSTSW